MRLWLALVLVANPVIAQPSSPGERAYMKCFSCHSVVAGEDGLQGPNLHGVLGRKAGTLAGFDYSPAMKRAGTSAGLVWDRARLEAFLQEPDSVVPGTVMARPPLASADERRMVLDYLETARR
jgi:cytochrome c